MHTSYPHPEGCVVPEIQWRDGYFSVCATVYSTPERPQTERARDRQFVRGGQLDAEDYPEEFRKFLPFHLFDANGPMHYVANSLYHASDKDCWGLKKGEVVHRKDKDGRPLWQLKHQPLAVGDKPPPQEWEPVVRIGEGKEPNLAHARSCACWPDAELCDFTEEKLLARLPALMKEFVTVCGEYLPQEVIDKWK